MKRKLLLVALPLVSFTLFSFVFKVQAAPGLRSYFDELVSQHDSSLMEQGRETFRYATFGDEAWWGGQLQLHKAIEGSHFGGVGPGLSPAEALAAGLKVDVDALPKSLQDAIERWQGQSEGPRCNPAVTEAQFCGGRDRSLQ